MQMIINYYGGHVNKDNLIFKSKTNRNGTTGYNIKETFISLGLDAKGIKCNVEDINSNNIIFPCIANVIIDNKYKHYIVIYEINLNKNYILIADPADKIKKMSVEQFKEIFNNVIIMCYPTRNLPYEKDISNLDFIFSIVKPYHQELKNIFILSLFITIFSILTSFYTENMLDTFNTFSKANLVFIFIIFFSIYILKNITNFFRSKALTYLNRKINLVLTLDVFKRIIKLPYCYFKNKTTGDMVSRINDLENVREMISRVALSIFIDLPLTLVSLVILFIISKTLFLIGFLMLILYFIVAVLFRRIFNNYLVDIKYKRSEYISHMIESISGYETIKGIHIESSVINKFEKKYITFLNKIFNYQNLYIIQELLKDLINDIGFILITLIGTFLVLDNSIRLGTLFTFSSLLIYFLEPIKNILSLDQVIKESKISLRRILDVIIYEESENGIIDTFSNGDIEFKNLSFSFNDKDNILDNINLTINRGEKLMVIGKSGTGKSTMFKLLMGYYKTPINSIRINDINLNDYKKETLNKNILYISQQEILFNDTLYNNLVFGNNNLESLNNVIEICNIDNIMDSNLKYNTLIEENGSNLSGGERQRVVLARTLLKNFNILIIDEGLSEVDIDTERKVLKEMFRKYNDKTIIIISHRLDNMDLFDSVLRFNDKNVFKECRNG